MLQSSFNGFAHELLEPEAAGVRAAGQELGEPTRPEQGSGNGQEGGSSHEASHAQQPVQQGPADRGMLKQGQAGLDGAPKQGQDADVQPKAVHHWQHSQLNEQDQHDFAHQCHLTCMVQKSLSAGRGRLRNAQAGLHGPTRQCWQQLSNQQYATLADQAA